MTPIDLLSERQILLTIDTALESARAEPVSASLPRGRANAERSSNFVEFLAQCLEGHFAAAVYGEVHVLRRTRRAEVFRRGNGECRREFLFDILAGQVGYVAPPVHRRAKPLSYIHTPLFQVESELAKDTAASVEDFCKLVCGSALQSLFVGPLTPKPAHYLDTLGAIARETNREHYVALVQHPDRWSGAMEMPRLFRWSSGGWRPIAR